jgi:hypothetical protein
MSTMAAAAAAPPAGNPQPSSMIPFLAGSYEYSEPITSLVQQPGASQVDTVTLITPGGFLRGVSLDTTGAGGVLGAGALSTDAPWIAFANLSIESIDGTPLLYPMPGLEHYAVSRFCRPWDGDPAQDPQYSNVATTPAFNLRLFLETRMTIGVLPNTDARAQYRLRLSIAPSSILFTTAPTTVPTLTVQVYLETYAQPPASDYAGNGIAQLPDGLVIQRFVSREIFNTNGGNQILKSNRVGNLIRTVIMIVRNNASPSVRTDLTADPIRWRLDNTQLLNEQRQRRYYENSRFFTFGGYGQAPGSQAAVAAARQTGVLCFPRHHNPGTMDGPYWLPTTEATYLAWELNGTPAGGTIEFITEDLAPAGPIPSYMMGI